ncbi:MAG: metallophosphoesterase [Wenzhouxiangella sp.]|nr:metallophosphoesterase [Wenzhouxiangella sp.]
MALLLVALAGCATARGAGDFHFRDVDRTVAVGDIHGNWDGYIATLKAANLIDDRNRWIGGETHLVQIGDIPGRGPDTRRVIEHLQRLKRQASRAGGQVHHLIGNHEAMNVYGDLRYTVPGEFAAFADRDSDRLRQRYLDALLERMAETDPEAYEALPSDFRERWLAEHPEGWLEHRYAWSPLWDNDGEMYEWVLDSAVAVKINDIVFVHGGLSTAYCAESLASLTRQAHEALSGRTDEELGILADPTGPIWYRGLSGIDPVASPAQVQAILDRHEAEHIVVGHTPTGGTIHPRYGNRVIQIDVGIGRAYGGHVGYLEITPEGLFAGYVDGRVRLPETVQDLADYARAVAELHLGNEAVLDALKGLDSTGAPIVVDPAELAEARVSCGIRR